MCYGKLTDQQTVPVLQKACYPDVLLFRFTHQKKESHAACVSFVFYIQRLLYTVMPAHRSAEVCTNL